MEIFALVGLSAYCFVSLVVGIRLLALSRRTRELPELLMGLAFLTGGAIGYPILVASTQVLESQPALSRTLYYLAMPFVSGCSVLLYRFWQNVYHPGERRAAGVFWIAAALLALGLAGQWATTDVGSISTRGSWYLLQIYVQGGAYAINTLANLRFHMSLRRRIPLGLAEPIVANRVLLWALASLAVVVQYVYSIGLVYVTPEGQQVVPNPGIISALGLAAGVLILLAFFPPGGYRRWVDTRSSGGAAG